MWRIIRAAAALVCGFCLWPLSVCLQSSIVPFFKLPAALIFHLFSNASLWAFYFCGTPPAELVCCHTWAGNDWGYWEAISTWSPPKLVILKLAVCPLSPGNAPGHSCRKASCWGQVHPGLMDHGWATHWSLHSLRCFLCFGFDLLTCGHMDEGVQTCAHGRRRAALLHTGATVEG